MANESRLQALQEMLADDPQDAFTRYALAMELASLERPADALTGFAELVELDPDYVPTYYQYGNLLAKQGQTERACEVIRLGIARAEAASDDHAARELADLLEDVSE
jgi:tetratricopeptide (TPR) repeat protein